MCATLKGHAVSLSWTLALVLYLGFGLASAGDVAVQTDAEGEHACLKYAEPIVDRTPLCFNSVGFVSPEAQEDFRRDLERPTLPYHVDTEHFRIWYDTSGVDSIYGWPDTTYLHTCKVAAERVWRGLVDTLGFRPPPPDGNDPDGGGGSDHYDIYFMHFEIFGGIAYCWNTLWPVPGDPPLDFTSFVVIDNDQAAAPWHNPIDMIGGVIGHEVGHATQLAHVGYGPNWYFEATSVWDSEQMYDHLNMYLIDRFGDGPLIVYALRRPYVSLEMEEYPRYYSRVLWNFFLSETFGNAIVPEVWYDMEDNTFPPINQILSMTHVLSDYGVELEDAVEEYCIWNWFTGNRDDGNHYEEGGDPGWPESTPQAVYSTYPVLGGSPPDTCRPDHLACNYVHFERGSADDEVLRITYDGPALISTPNAVHVTYLDDALNSFYLGEIPLNPFGNGAIDVEGFNEMNLVCLVVINRSLPDGTDNMNYTVDAELIPTGVADAGRFELSAAVPNPFTLGTDIAYSVPAGVTQAALSVYDASGRLVTTLVDAVVTPGDAVTHWDGTDTHGRQTASGVYFVRFVSGDETAVRKIVLLK